MVTYTKLENIRRLLDVLSRTSHFITLYRLAKQARFSSAKTKQFRNALQFLLDQNIVEIQQSGWKSEKRGNKNHPKGIILLQPIFTHNPTSDEEDFSLDQPTHDKRHIPQKPTRQHGNKQLQKFLSTTHDCLACKSEPYVYITNMHIPICHNHWNKLITNDVVWSDHPDFLTTE